MEDEKHRDKNTIARLGAPEGGTWTENVQVIDEGWNEQTSEIEAIFVIGKTGEGIF